MKGFFKSFFGISGKEVSGFLLLCAALLITLSIPQISAHFRSGSDHNYAADQAILDSLLMVLESVESTPPEEEVRFIFDPNAITYDSLRLLGFSAVASAQVVNYRNKGGRFYLAEDLYKIYNIDSAHLTALIPYIKIPEQQEQKAIGSQPKVANLSTTTKPAQHKAETMVLPKFNINTADTAILQTIKGIGSVFAGRIVSFRTNLGGFVSLNQLYEVYNLDSTTVRSLLEQSFIAEEYQPQQIAINAIDEENLRIHPYVSRDQARLIIAYRNQHGAFRNTSDLAQVYLMDSITIRKLEPYISWGAVN